MRASYGDGRRLSNIFFTSAAEGSNLYVFKCGVKRKKTGTSYANLVSHIYSAHPDCSELFSSNEPVDQTTVDKFFTKTNSSNLYGWFDFIINALLPFSAVEKKVIRDHVKHKPVSLSTFMRHLQLISEIVEEKISRLLPEKFVLVFDGWSSSSTHYISIFASFSSSNPDGYETRLLTFSPLHDESSLGADEHIAFIEYILEVYQKSWSNVVALVGDNVSVNRSISTKTGIPIIGCAIHRLNLVVNHVLVEYEYLLNKINKLMVKLRGLILSARLRKLTHLRPKLRNVTRWSSTHEMVLRYKELEEFLPRLESEEVDEISLSVSENRRVESMVKRLGIFDSITKELQKERTTLSEVRAVFDAVIEEFPVTDNRLSWNARIVCCSDFESAIVKLQRGSVNALSRDEEKALSALRLSSSIEREEELESLNFVERALKRQKCHYEDSSSHYVDTRFVLATSNVCERLFSKIGYAQSDRRMGLTPANLESQIFLHMNRDLWGVEDFSKLGL